MTRSLLERVAATLRFALSEFGPLIAFLLLNWRFGIKVAIAGTVAFVFIDGVRRLWTHVQFTRIYVLTGALTVVFGAVDLFAASPFMLKYEAVITNVATGLVFAAGARGEKPLLQQLAEQRQRQPFPDRADVRRFFELFTLAWACYFLLKAAVYLWMSGVLSLASAVAWRSLIGGTQHGRHAGCQHHPGTAPVLPVRQASPAAGARRQRPSRRGVTFRNPPPLGGSPSRERDGGPSGGGSAKRGRGQRDRLDTRFILAASVAGPSY